MHKDQIIVLSDDDDLPTLYSHASRTTGARPLAPRQCVDNILSSRQNASTSSADSTQKKTPALYRSKVLSGKTFAFRGIWLTMTVDAAEDLCKANGGEVVAAITSRTSYVVIGGKGSNLPVSKFTEYGSQLLSEKDFLDMILCPENPNVSKEIITGSSKGKKRPADENEGSSSRPTKARKSDPGDNFPDTTWIHSFLRDRGEIEIRGKTLHAYDCGGEVFKAQRGKTVMDLLMKFETFLEECKGEYHNQFY